jgi:hypothetical protein
MLVPGTDKPTMVVFFDCDGAGRGSNLDFDTLTVVATAGSPISRQARGVEAEAVPNVPAPGSSPGSVPIVPIVSRPKNGNFN